MKRSDSPANVPRRQKRREVLLEIAARHFVQRGFEAASMRDIAADVGIRPSSIYHHFPSKEDLMLAVYEEGMRRITHAVTAATAGVADPWQRLECACAAHLRSLLEGGDLFLALMREAPPSWHHANKRIVRLRDAYESIFTGILSDLRLPPRFDRHLLRLALLGAMNWSHQWYRPGRLTPTKMARQIVSFMRVSLDGQTGNTADR